MQASYKKAGKKETEKWEMGNKQRINNKLSDLSCNILKIALNINDQIQQLITEIGRVDWKNTQLNYKYNDVGRLKEKDVKIYIMQTNMNVKEERVAVLISDKGAFRTKTSSREGWGRHLEIEDQSTQPFLCHLSCLLTSNISSLNLSVFISKMETISSL